MSFPRGFRFAGGAGLFWQVAGVALAWAYLCALHWDNDGLWFQSDAPRHAANGLFWKEYLLSLSSDPKGFALSYYARYPVINPTAYPPVFHLLEGALFGLLGPSPYAAKGLVLGFALVAALYTTAWLRRWVAEEAGWAGALVPLLPGVVVWSHVVMLNVPAFALDVAALYHARRWLESPAASPPSRHLYPAAALAGLATLTYFTAGVVAFIILAWLVALRRWDLLRRPQTLAAGAVCALPVAAYLAVAFRWSPIQAGFVTSSAEGAWTPSAWAFYPGRLPDLVSPHLIALAALGAVFGLWGRRWRRTVLLSLIWPAVVYVVFTPIAARQSRYVLVLCTPLVCLGAIAVFALAQAAAPLVKGGPGTAKALALAAVAVLLGAQAWLAARVPLRPVHGFEEVVAFLEEVAPDEPVFYDGPFHNLFTFHVQARDPGYRRRVVLGNKLLYADAVDRGWHLRQFVFSPEEAVEALRERGGCHWLAIEVSDLSEELAPARILREAVKGPQFELVRSFPIPASRVERVEVYRLLEPVQPQEEVEMPFPGLGGGASYRVRPIERGGGR